MLVVYLYFNLLQEKIRRRYSEKSKHPQESPTRTQGFEEET